MPTSAISGTANTPSATAAMMLGRVAWRCANSVSRTSNTSSSCTCMMSLLWSAWSCRYVATAIMARLIKSDAVPCMGALMAARSAPVRMA